MILGFTGTRHGLTDPQLKELSYFLQTFQSSIASVLHGDCVGSDAQLHNMAETLNLKIVIYPPNKSQFRAFCKSPHSQKPAPYLARDRAIVDACSMLVACPREMEMQPKGGTWYTVRYARKAHKPNLIIYPDGSLEYQNA